MTTRRLPTFSALTCDPSNGLVAVSFTTTNIRRVLIFRATASVTIDRVQFRCGSNTGSPTSIVWTAGIQGVTATRKPDGTWKGATANGNGTVSHTASALNTVTLTETVDLVAGEWYAIVLYVSSAGTLDAGNCPRMVTTTHPVSANSNSWRTPYYCASTDGGSTYTQGSNPIALAALEAGGTAHGSAVLTRNAPSWNSGSNPLYRGTKFTLPVTRVLGWFDYYGRGSTDTRDFTFELFEGSNTTPILTVAMENDVHISAVGTGYGRVYVPPTTCTAGTIYRLTVRPTTADAIDTFQQEIFEDAYHAALALVPSEYEYTQSPSAIAWTDTANSVFSLSPGFIEEVIASGGATRSVIVGG